VNQNIRIADKSVVNSPFKLMSAKQKLFFILLLSIFATVATGIYITHSQSYIQTTDSEREQHQGLSIVESSSELVVYSERSHYKTIPLDSINSILQGSDPATLALSVLDDRPEISGLRKVEVSYPQRNLALVTITQLRQNHQQKVKAVRYRVEMSSFGRSLLVSSPPVWEIVWAGSQENGE
jgi:hypothetical protein